MADTKAQADDPAACVRVTIGDDAVAVVTVARPAKRNALNWAVFDGLHAATGQIVAAIDRGEVRAVLLAGEGAAFSAGLDVALFGEQVSAGSGIDIAYLQSAFSGFEDLHVPTVAAVHGFALGAGCQLALAAHLRVAAPGTRFALLEGRFGLIPDLGATYRLPRLIGLSRATDLAITAREIDADTALAWGMVDAILPDADFAAGAHTYAARLAAGPTVASGALPVLMRKSFSRSRDKTMAAERSAQRRCLDSADFAAAARAAAAGERPDFHGK